MWQYHCCNLSRKKLSYSGIETAVTNKWLTLCETPCDSMTLCVSHGRAHFGCFWVYLSIESCVQLVDRNTHSPLLLFNPLHSWISLFVGFSSLILMSSLTIDHMLIDWRELFCSVRIYMVIFLHLFLYKLLFLHFQLWKSIHVHMRMFVSRPWLLVLFCACSASALW